MRFLSALVVLLFLSTTVLASPKNTEKNGVDVKKDVVHLLYLDNDKERQGGWVIPTILVMVDGHASPQNLNYLLPYMKRWHDNEQGDEKAPKGKTKK